MPPHPAPARLLLADDDPALQRLIAYHLTEAGYIVQCVIDGRQALDAVQRGGIDLVLIDYQMPVLNGLEATRAIRALEAPVCDVSIIALTARHGDDMRAQCLTAGMNDFLNKPFLRNDLIATIERWLTPRCSTLRSPLPTAS